MLRGANIDSDWLVLAAAQNSTSKWIKDFNIKPDTLNLREENMGNNIECTDV